MTLVLLIAVASLAVLVVLAVLYRIIFVATNTTPNPDDLVTVAEPGNEVIANIIRDRLLDAGIAAMARNTHPLGAARYMYAEMWEVRVRYADLDRAREVLGEED